MKNFDACLKPLLEHEGGNDDDKNDPGGRTSRGIIQSEYDRYRQRHGQPQRDVWSASDAEVRDIYKTEYWDAMRCDDLPAGVDYAVFDYGVNSGIARAAKVLQGVIGVTADGEIGPETLKYSHLKSADLIVKDMSDERLRFLQGLRTWPRFGRGWSRRVAEVRDLALKMAASKRPGDGDASAPTKAPEGGRLQSLISGLAAAIAGVFGGWKTEPVATDLASRIVAAMRRKRFRLDTEPGQVNIVYVEGMNPDGTANDNRNNVFNDLRAVIVFEGGKPRLAGAWEATTEPSRKWTLQPMNPGGAFHIAFGQQTAWRVGIHHAGSASAHEALVQAGVISGFRDPDKTLKRDLAHPYSGDDMGVNQHWGYDLPHDDMGNSSAGCLVGRSTSGHREFMALIKSDPRYRADRSFTFTATVLPASEIA